MRISSSRQPYRVGKMEHGRPRVGAKGIKGTALGTLAVHIMQGC